MSIVYVESIMQEDLPIQRGLTIPGHELDVQASVGGGPGGQHVNKSATRISLRWNVAASGALTMFQRQRLMEKLSSRLTNDGEIVLHVHQHRSQQRNLEEARDRLTAMVKGALIIPKARRPTKPTRASKKRRVESKKRRANVKKNRGRVRHDD